MKDFVKEVFDLCDKYYEFGGDIIVECWTEEQVRSEFKNIQEVKDYIALRLEQKLNCRWGEDNDPQLEEYRKAMEWLSAT
jgi:hypothetical protein